MDNPAKFEEIRFPFHPQQRQRFLAGDLWPQWASCYPNIFDDLDVSLVKSQGHPGMGYHFYEWLAAILLYESTGYLSLVEQYEFKRHERKRSILEQLVPSEVLNLITNHSAEYGWVQSPDLLVYGPDLSDWYFCEVKGPGDSLHEQQNHYFQALMELSLKPIRVIHFYALKK